MTTAKSPAVDAATSNLQSSGSATGSRPRTVAMSSQEYARGVVGGLIFSLPLLYTMEMWWAGFILHPGRLIGYIAATLVLLLGYNFFVGIRRDTTFLEVFIDSVEEMGLGLVIATLILWLLGRITTDMTMPEILGKIVIEAMTVAIGVSVGTAQLGNSPAQEADDNHEEPDQGDRGCEPGGVGVNTSEFVSQLIIGTCGAVLFASNVAPTEEILLLGVEMSPTRLLGLAALSLVMAALILNAIDFRGAQQFSRSSGWLSILAGVTVTYAIALLSSAAILWFFGRFDGISLSRCVAQTVVLAFPAVLGASAGRLLLQATDTSSDEESS